MCYTSISPCMNYFDAFSVMFDCVTIKLDIYCSVNIGTVSYISHNLYRYLLSMSHSTINEQSDNLEAPEMNSNWLFTLIFVGNSVRS